MSMTQKELVMDYVRRIGSITPAKVGGTPWNGGFFGSETSKRCRELRAEGKLVSKTEGKFEKYSLPSLHTKVEEKPATTQIYAHTGDSLFEIDQYQIRV